MIARNNKIQWGGGEIPQAHAGRLRSGNRNERQVEPALGQCRDEPWRSTTDNCEPDGHCGVLAVELSHQSGQVDQTE